MEYDLNCEPGIKNYTWIVKWRKIMLTLNGKDPEKHGTQKLLDYFSFRGEFFVAIDPIKISLNSYLKFVGKLGNIKELRRLAILLIKIVSHLQSLGIVHNNISLKNFGVELDDYR